MSICYNYKRLADLDLTLYENLGNASWTLKALSWGAESEFLNREGFGYGVLRFTYSLGCSIILGVLGTVFNLLAEGWYMLKFDRNNFKKHLKGAFTDLMEVVNLAFLVGFADPIASGCLNMKAGYHNKIVNVNNICSYVPNII